MFEFLENKIKNIEIYDTIGSTNDRAKELALNGAEDGSVIIADVQTMGRGQKGRSFYCESGQGLYMSVILRPEIPAGEAMGITARVAVAVAEAIESLVPCDVKIKWVNDLYLNGRKICGILTEGSAESGILKYAVVGIGVNTGKIEFPSELLNIATSVFNETGCLISREELAYEIIKRIKSYDAGFMEKYRKRSLLFGKTVSVKLADREFDAVVSDIDENGFLVVTEGGRETVISSGEVRLL